MRVLCLPVMLALVGCGSKPAAVAPPAEPPEVIVMQEAEKRLGVTRKEVETALLAANCSVVSREDTRVTMKFDETYILLYGFPSDLECVQILGPASKPGDVGVILSELTDVIMRRWPEKSRLAWMQQALPVAERGLHVVTADDGVELRVTSFVWMGDRVFWFEFRPEFKLRDVPSTPTLPE